MMKFIIGLLLLVVLALGAVLLVREDPGFLMIRYRDFSVETTLAFGIGLVFLLVVVLHYAFKLLRGIWRLPEAIQLGSLNRRYEKSRRQLTQGLIDLAEGRFEQAENNLVRLVGFSESPLLHYLAAARAAQLQGKHDARDSYLKAAHEARPEAEIAIGVTQAELQLAHQQTEQALATLSHLHSVAPRHDYVSMLLARAYFELEDWAALVELLPDVRRKITIEYTMMDRINDRDEHARELAILLKDIPCKINLIPFNPFTGSSYRRVTNTALNRFRDILHQEGYTVTVRTTRGDDIAAACGQLAGTVNDRTRRSQRYQQEQQVVPVRFIG